MLCQQVHDVSPLSPGFQNYEILRQFACHPWGPCHLPYVIPISVPVLPRQACSKVFKTFIPVPLHPPHHNASLLVPSSKWWVGGEVMHPLGIFLLWVPTQVLRKCCSSLLQVLSRGKAGRRQSQIPFYSPVEGREGVCLERGQELLFDESPLHTQSHTGDIPDISSLQPRLQRQV